MKHTERTPFRLKGLAKPVACLTLALSAVVATHAAFATNIKTTTSSKGDNWTSDPSTSSYGKWPVGNPVGRYMTHIDHWNPSSNGSMTMSSETDPAVQPSFSVDGWTDVMQSFSGYLDFTQSASVYDVPKNVWNTLEGEDGSAFTDANGHPQPGHMHAPAAYPSIYKGCHWGECSVGDGAPFPILVGNIDKLQSTWTIADPTGTSADAGVWDAAYDIWFDTNARGHLPGDPKALQQKPSPVTPQELQYGQNDGAEVMIWMNNHGYNNMPITPAGTQQPSPVTINVGGNNMVFDVWIARLGSPDAYQWNVISYVAQNKVTTFGSFDANEFVKNAKLLTCPTAAPCISDSWWITSIQAGFEVWARGVGLKTTAFDVTPTFKPGANTSVNSGRTNDGGTPLVNWQTPFQINMTGCAGGTAAYSIVEAGDSTNALPIQVAYAGMMTETQPGYYSAFIGQLYPRHGDAIVTMTINCPDGSKQTTNINIYIDPSGVVKNTKGEPIDSATMTLYRFANGVYSPVPNGSTIMAAYNRRNPDTSGEMGTFGWDVQAGTYKVRAAKAGCYLPGNPNQPYVESAALVVPPAVTNLNLVLECPANGGGGNNGVNVQLTVNGSDWQNGYCRNVVLTNTTSKPVTWKVQFNLPFPNSVIDSNNHWNLNYTQSGGSVTAWGVGWNSVIQPGQTLKDQGFCASK